MYKRIKRKYWVVENYSKLIATYNTALTAYWRESRKHPDQADSDLPVLHMEYEHKHISGRFIWSPANMMRAMVCRDTYTLNSRDFSPHPHRQYMSGTKLHTIKVFKKSKNAKKNKT